MDAGDAAPMPILEAPAHTTKPTGRNRANRVASAPDNSEPTDPRAASRVRSTPNPRSKTDVSTDTAAVQKIQRPNSSRPRPRAITSDVARPIKAPTTFDAARTALMWAMRAIAPRGVLRNVSTPETTETAVTERRPRARQWGTPQSGLRAPDRSACSTNP